MKHRKRGDNPESADNFHLPPDISFSKRRLSYGWAYVFRHRSLGELGRIVLEEIDDGRTHIALEVAGDPADPMTAERTAIFGPLGMDLAQRIEAATGVVTDNIPLDPPPRPPGAKGLIESRLIHCHRCGALTAMPIFAPLATDTGRFKDYARKMYPEYSRLNVLTWIIGPALGEGPLINRPAEILKIWATREPITEQRPAQFNAMLDRLEMTHCG